MPFPASQNTLFRSLSAIQSRAIKVKSQTQLLRDASAVGATGRQSYLDLQRQLQIAIDDWDVLSAVPGLAQYAKDQFSDQAFNIAAEYNAMRAAAVTLRDWIFVNIPTDSGSGAVLIHTVDNEGVRTELTVSSGGASDFRTEADAFTATIS